MRASSAIVATYTDRAEAGNKRHDGLFCPSPKNVKSAPLHLAGHRWGVRPNPIFFGRDVSAYCSGSHGIGYRDMCDATALSESCTSA